MELNRRELMKRAFRTGLVLFGGAALSKWYAASSAGGGRKTEGRRRMAMAVDHPRLPGGRSCRDCITACHRGHNVPAIPDKKRAITWIWKETLRSRLPR